MDNLISQAGYSDGDVDTNTSTNLTLNEIVQSRHSRRQALASGASATAFALFGTSFLAACNEDGNTAPVVGAGQNAATNSGRVVTLTGTATDADGLGLSSWTQVSGPNVQLSAITGATVTFLAPSVASATELRFRFTASDAKGAVSSAESTVTINPAALGFTSIPKNRNDVVTVPAG